MTHIRTHYKIRPFICSHCSKTFNEKGNLKTHLRIHTGERPYQCLECKKNFKALGQLKDHILSHTYYKPFQCPYCFKNFRRKGILKHHMKIHLKDPNYLYNKAYYEKYFRELKLESFSIKHLMKLYASKTDSKKKMNLKKIKGPKKNDIEINIPIEEVKKVEREENAIKSKEKNNTNLLKIENKNIKNNSSKKSKITINDGNNLLNNGLNQVNNSQINNYKLRELFDNNVVNNSLINVNNNQSIDLLNIINNKKFFNINNNLEFPLNNNFNNNYLPFNANNLLNFNNNFILNNLFNNSLYSNYINNLNQLNLNVLNQNLLNVPGNLLTNTNTLLQVKLDFLNSLGNLGQNLPVINPNYMPDLKIENKE